MAHREIPLPQANWPLSVAATFGVLLLGAGCRTPWQSGPSSEPEFVQPFDAEPGSDSWTTAGSARSASTLNPADRRSPSDRESALRLRRAYAEQRVDSADLLPPKAIHSQPPSPPSAAGGSPVADAAPEKPAATAESNSAPAAAPQSAQQEEDAEAGTEETVVIRLSDLNESGSHNATATAQRLERSGPSDHDSQLTAPPAEAITGSRPAADTSVTTVAYEAPQANAAQQSGKRLDAAAIDDMELEDLGDALLRKLEKASRIDEHPQSQIELATKQRLVHWIMGDMDAVAAPIDGMPPAAQAYLQATFQGLHEATDANGSPAESRRMSRALLSHRKAEEQLSALANLEILNLCFCTEVDSFGVVTRFPKYEFSPEQEVLLYCELENFVSKPVRGGYETRLQGSYEIVDSAGHKIADQALPEDSDVCANRRRDFYIAYHLFMPQRIGPGQYQLRLIIEDMQGNKYGQSQLDFRIRKP
jgi:hypothetical protein